MTRLSIALIIIAILAVAGGFIYQRWSQGPDVSAPVGFDWAPLALLEATGDIGVITGTFGGMADDDRFRILTTQQVVTGEGTYVDTRTRVAVIGVDTEIQSAATGTGVDYATLVRLDPGSPVSVLVQGSKQDEPEVNAYLIILP